MRDVSGPIEQFIRVTLLVTALVICLEGCSSTSDVAAPDFAPGYRGDVTPWTHVEFDNAEDKFTFAIISDLWGGNRASIFEVAVEQLNLLRPEMVMSVGDLIDGGTEDLDQLAREWDEFEALASGVNAPLFRVGGNHDLTNAVMRNVWEDRFGATYYHFRYKDVLFLVLNSEDFDPQEMQEIYLARAKTIALLQEGRTEEAEASSNVFREERYNGEISSAQSAYFEKVIQANTDVRWTFLFMHKPVWLRDDYDKGLQRIEAALQGKSYSVFNGHFHSFSNVQRNGQSYTMLATTGGGQNASNEKAFDQLTLVTVDSDGPVVAHLRMDGILGSAGLIPAGGDALCFQASVCGE